PPVVAPGVPVDALASVDEPAVEVPDGPPLEAPPPLPAPLLSLVTSSPQPKPSKLVAAVPTSVVRRKSRRGTASVGSRSVGWRSVGWRSVGRRREASGASLLSS